MGHHIDSVARLLGNSYAHVQHGIDKAIEWGFSKMEEQAKSGSKTRAKPQGIFGNVAAFARGFFNVVGEAGTAYYRTYSELKKKP